MKKIGTIVRGIISKALRDPSVAAAINETLDIPGIDEAAEREIIAAVLERAANHFDPEVG